MTAPQNTDTRTIESHVDGLSSAVTYLIDILGRETTAVKEININEFTSLQAQKSDALHQYSMHMNALLNQKNQIKLLPESVKSRIRHFEENLSLARTENMTALERAGKSMERLRDRIAQIARDSVIQSGTSYGPNGKMYNSARKAISTGLSDRA